MVSRRSLLGYMFKNEYTIPLIIAFVLNWFALSLVGSTATVLFCQRSSGGCYNPSEGAEQCQERFRQ